MRTWLVLAVTVIAGCAQSPPPEQQLDSWMIPPKIKKCLESFASSSTTSLTMNLQINPYYLRGDFDGDGEMDLAIALRGPNADVQLGIGICRNHRPPVLLGNISRSKRFTDDPADRVASVGWVVVNRAEVNEILAKSNPSRHQLTGIRRTLITAAKEMIYMPYEDADGLIYFQKDRFRWYTINSTEMPQDEPAGKHP